MSQAELRAQMLKMLQPLRDLAKPFDSTAASKKNTTKSIETRQEGNKFYKSQDHDQNEHSKILSFYTKSAALAESGSEELALAYGNRSALLLHLKRYKECLVDIERATQITKSEKLKAKLAARRADCLALKDKTKDSQPKKLPTPLSSRVKNSKVIPCASKSITIKFDDKYGRHIVATEKIDPGSIIVIEKAFVTAPVESTIYLNCTHCLDLAWNAIPCDSCAVALFCSENCKEEALLQYHDVECMLLPLFNFRGNWHVRLAIKLFIKSLKTDGFASMIKNAQEIENNEDASVNGFFDNGTFQSSKFKSIYNLSVSNSKVDYVETVLSDVINFLHKNTNILNENTCSDAISIAKNILYKLDYPTWCVTDPKYSNQVEEAPALGVMLSPFGSLFNHNCSHNVERFFTRDQEIVLFTTAVIKKGQQLCINYGSNIYMEKKERQSYLKRRYDFTCTCEACNENWDINSLSNEKYDEKTMMKFSKELDKAGVQDSTMEIFNRGFTKLTVSERTYKDFVKVMKGVNKYYTCWHAFVSSLQCLFYFIFFFGNLYGVKNDIPDEC